MIRSQDSFSFNRTINGLNLILAPLIYLAGQYLLSRWQALQPDIIWTLSHALLVIGAGLFLPLIAALRNYLGAHSPMLASLGSALAFFGAVGLIGQFSIDLAVGQIAVSQPAMSAAFHLIRAAPGMNLIFYTLAPICLFIGLLVIVLLLTFARLIPFWMGLIGLGGFIGIGVAVVTNSIALFLAGFACLALITPFGVGWRLLNAPQRAQRHQPLPAGES